MAKRRAGIRDQEYIYEFEGGLMWVRGHLLSLVLILHQIDDLGDYIVDLLLLL